MLLILVAIFLWSTLAILVRAADMTVATLMFSSCVVSTFLSGALLLTPRYRHEIPPLKPLLPLLPVGPVSLLNTFTFFYSYKNTTVANAVLTHYTAPIVVALLAPIVLKERLTLQVATAVAIATLGLWVMLGMAPGEVLGLFVAGDRDTAGILAGLVSGAAYAVLVIALRMLAPKVHPLVMTFVQNGVIALLLLPFVEMPPDLVGCLWVVATMGIVHSTVAPILYFQGLRTVTASRAAILGYLEPVCAIALGALFLSEAIMLRTVLGGALIVLSGYLTIRAGSGDNPASGR
jgi:drug/metabolite transporter (DMT)-like permease